MALLTWVAIGTLWSVFQGIPMARIFFDMNAFLYLPVVPLGWMLMRSTSERQERIYEVLTAGVTVTALLGLVLLGLYHTHTGNLSEVYRWIANTKTGEITFIGSSTYRIFLQSQIYGLLLGLLLVVRPVNAWQRWMWIPLIAGSAAIWTSLSRSFWLGVAAGCIAIVVLLVRRAVPWKTVLLRSIGAVAAGFFLFSWANSFPNPLPWAASTNPLTQRNEDIGSEQASEARLNQIRPLLTAILHHPIIGPGFGTEVTYYNPDPRIRGDRTTTAFELGYLDWWLDLGLIGLALLGAWIWSLGRRTMSSPNLQMFLPSLIALSAVHLTTVYFNHPLGIGWLAVLTLFLYDHE
jgi:O-antigen ligase